MQGCWALASPYDGTEKDRDRHGPRPDFAPPVDRVAVGRRPPWADQQTLEARAYGVARPQDPFWVNTAFGFIGPEILYDGKQIIRPGPENYCRGTLVGLTMGVAGVNVVMGVPPADNVMLNDQSTSFHDALYIRRALGLRPAPAFEAWLAELGPLDDAGHVRAHDPARRGGSRRRFGTTDSERNCVSNIRPPHGLGYSAAADTLAWLITEARKRGLTGVGRRFLTTLEALQKVDPILEDWLIGDTVTPTASGSEHVEI